MRVELAIRVRRLRSGCTSTSPSARWAGRSDRATIPASAVQNINNGQVVFCDRRPERLYRAARPARFRIERQYPVLEGIFVGDRVVTVGSFMLRAEWLKLNPGGSQTQSQPPQPQHRH